MIRVFLISLVALVALAMVAHHLPAELRPAGGDDESLLGRWEGAWEGTLVSYRPDGSTLQSVRARYEYRRVSATEQTLVMTDRAPDGSMYTIDGAGSPGKEGLLLFEGRFHRVDRAGE